MEWTEMNKMELNVKRQSTTEQNRMKWKGNECNKNELNGAELNGKGECNGMEWVMIE